MKNYDQSDRLVQAKYDIRGSVYAEARKMIAAGKKVYLLHSGNPPLFGMNPPAEMIEVLKKDIHLAFGYSDGKGLLSAREAVAKYSEKQGIKGVTPEDVIMGDGVSNFIFLTMQALLNKGDEVLLPRPIYPLWNASVCMFDGTPVFYDCPIDNGYNPIVEEMEKQITPKTKAIVVINPNNPTGVVYSKETLLKIVDLARRHNLILISDEIYGMITYDDAVFYPLASLSDDVFTITLSGLSKSHNIPGFRVGWSVFSGPKDHVKGYIEGMNTVSSMKMCSNTVSQLVVPWALENQDELNISIKPGGRLYEQRRAAYDALTSVPEIKMVKPSGAMYLFPKLDPKVVKSNDDKALMLEILKATNVLLVHGSAFYMTEQLYFRVVLLAPPTELGDAMTSVAKFLTEKSQ